MTRFERWVITGWDPESGRQVPYNEHIPTPRHYHPEPPHWHPDCGECREAAQRAWRDAPASSKPLERERER
jgi:hypothetical protein